MDLFTEIQDRLESKKFLKTSQTFSNGYICSGNLLNFFH